MPRSLCRVFPVPDVARTWGALVLACGVTACSPGGARPQRAPVPVSLGTAHRAAVPYVITANGIAMPMQTAIVAPQVDGIVTKVAFHEGDDVARGQVLFEIQQRPYRAAVDQLTATLARDQASYENAKREDERYAQLVKQDYVTREQADQTHATALAAAATVQADQASLDAARFNLTNTVIRAPIAGRTGSLLVREGNVVHAAGATPLVVINQIRPILVRFAVPASDLPLIRRYESHGTLPVVASAARAPAAGGGPPTVGAGGPPQGGGTPAPSASDTAAAPSMLVVPDARGTLSFIDNAIDTTTGTIMLKATFPNDDETLWVGQFVTVSMRLFVEPNVLVVPMSAVLTGQQGPYVYVVDSTNAARQRNVTVERSTQSLAVIAAGLHDGDRVVTDGQSRLTPGAHITTRAASDTGEGPAPGTARRGSSGRARGGAGASGTSGASAARRPASP